MSLLCFILSLSKRIKVMETNNREAQNIDRLHLHYRDDGLLYKKHAKTPFSGIAEEYNLSKVLVSRVEINKGKQHGFIEGFCKDGRPLFRGSMKNGELDKASPLEIISADGSTSSSYIKNGELVENTSNENDLLTDPNNHYSRWLSNLKNNSSKNLNPMRIINSCILLSQ